jgi:biotin carboxylase
METLLPAATLLLFNYDWDVAAFERHLNPQEQAHAGFDLFSFPSNAQLVGFDLDKFANKVAKKFPGVSAVLSNHEQFGALAAALVAEKLGLPGTPPKAVVACQHKTLARQILQEVAPEANVPFAEMLCAYGDPVPHPLPAGLSYPTFVKPVKAAFSVLARTVKNQAELQAHTRFGWRELWVIRRLVEPFERVAQRLFPNIPTAHRMLLEQPVGLHKHINQYNLDGYVFKGEVTAMGVVDAVMYPGTQAFMRFDYPSKLVPAIQARALEIAQRFLKRIGFTHGMFNMEFFYDEQSDRLSVIEFNPRLASQLADLYRRVDGRCPHAMALALARGQDPAGIARTDTGLGTASSFVYRCFEPGTEPLMPSDTQVKRLQKVFEDALFLPMPKSGHSLDRDYKWLGSHRYGILHLGGRDEAHLRERCERASELLGWPAPYADAWMRHLSDTRPAPALNSLYQPEQSS